MEYEVFSLVGTHGLIREESHEFLLQEQLQVLITLVVGLGLELW